MWHIEWVGIILTSYEKLPSLSSLPKLFVVIWHRLIRVDAEEVLVPTKQLGTGVLWYYGTKSHG